MWAFFWLKLHNNMAKNSLILPYMSKEPFRRLGPTQCYQSTAGYNLEQAMLTLQYSIRWRIESYGAEQTSAH
jgi:hypothetical protein